MELLEPSSGSQSQATEDGERNKRKPGLHLVVLGHVDAGKSTLMGRLLFELGHVTQKDVHRNQRDAAVAGKVRVYVVAFLLNCVLIIELLSGGNHVLAVNAKDCHMQC
jgi:hypothetical protein